MPRPTAVDRNFCPERGLRPPRRRLNSGCPIESGGTVDCDDDVAQAVLGLQKCSVQSRPSLPYVCEGVHVLV